MLKKNIILMGLIIMCLGVFTGCEDIRITEIAQSGAYFASGNGKEFGVIHENKLTLFWDSNNNRYDVFEISHVKDKYIAENIRAKVTIKFSRENMIINLTSTDGTLVKNRKIKLKRNNSIKHVEEEPILLAAPQNISINDGGIDWRFEESIGSNVLYRSGILGAGIEIKCTDTDTFTTIAIKDFIPEPYCLFGVLFGDLALPRGTSIIRIIHFGGPFLQDDTIKISINSEAVYFNVNVDEQGSITVERIED